jgi:16S rRNA (cytosine1402-N4)-methyltransferase
VTADSYHEPVLCREAVEGLLTDPGGAYVDGTVGGGGHAEAILRRLASSGVLYCFDADADAIAAARLRLHAFGDRARFVHANFRTLGAELRARSVRSIQGIILDLGLSSHQIDEPSRGFSYRSNAELDMRFDQRSGLTAAEIVNTYDTQSLGTVLYEFGEERASRRIARAIVARRPIRTSGELAEAVGAVCPARFLTKTLARVFQALRIEVNRELEALETVLEEATGLLAPGGRMAVIAYHSLEDRMVKGFFRTASGVRPDEDRLGLPLTAPEPLLRVLTRRPVRPQEEESRRNPRARSARLRIAERLRGGTDR